MALSLMDVLQRTQNAAFYVATGCHHLDMKTAEYFEAKVNPGQPCYHLQMLVATCRYINLALASIYGFIPVRELVDA
mgnify:CR=1 FL=1